MASWIAKALEKLIPKQDIRVLFMGLDASGKTTILYMLKLGLISTLLSPNSCFISLLNKIPNIQYFSEVVTTIPTIGFNVETVEYKNVAFTAWDVGK